MPKSEMNALDVAAVVREMDLAGARVDQAWQPSPDEVLLRVRRSAAQGGKIDLACGVGRYAFVTRVPRMNPPTPPGFAVALRKHLGGGFVRGVRQHGFDRVVVLEVERKEGRLELVVELFHDGNAILVREGKIVATLVSQSFATRTLRPGVPYAFPPERLDPRSLSRAAIDTRLLASTVDVVRALAVDLNLGGVWAEEILARAGVPKHAPAAGLADAERARIHDALAAILARLDAGDFDPVVVRKDGEPVDVAPFPLASHEGLALERYESFSEALDAYFSKPPPEVAHDAGAERVKEEQDRLSRQLAQQKAAVAKFEREESEARRKGDLLYAHFQDVATLLKYLAQATRDIGWSAASERLKNHALGARVEKLFEHEGAASLLLPDEAGKPQRVRVDIRKSVQENAQDLYEKAKKLREKQTGAAKAMEETRKAKDAAERRSEVLLKDLEAERAKAKPTKRFWFETFRWFFTSEGALVLGGRDAAGNERVVKKHLGEDDRYVHADLHGAPSLVVKGRPGSPPSERSLEEAANYAISMSKAWTTGHASGDAYWVLPSQVTKTPQSGEYLARGAFVIRGKRNYVSGRVRLALAETEFEGERKVACGPPASLAGKPRLLVLEPGDEEKNTFAKRAAAMFGVPVEEILSVLPPGPVRVVERVGFLE